MCSIAWFDRKMEPEQDDLLYKGLSHGSAAQGRIIDGPTGGQLGPQHPSRWCVPHVVVIEVDCSGHKPVMGYLHRNHEKIVKKYLFTDHARD